MLEDDILNCIDKNAIFGLYASNPERFRFLPGEKSLIRQIVLHINSIKSKDDAHNKYFEMPSKHKISKKGLCYTSVGYLYGGKSKMVVNCPKENAADDEQLIDVSSKENLLSKLNSLLLNYELTTSDEMIEIRNDGHKIWAAAVCVLCKMTDKNQTIRVQYDTSNRTLKPYWNTSNFSKHLRTMHNDGTMQDNKRKRKLPRQLNSLNENDEKKTSDTDDYEPGEKEFLREFHATNESVASPNQEIETDTVLKNDLDEYIKPIYNQISAQNLILTQAIKTHSERITTMAFELKCTSRTIDVIEQQQNGNCLFLSLAHQIFMDKVNSIKHTQAAKKLRERVVQHIIKNFDRFQKDVEWRLVEMEKSKSDLDEAEMIKECRFFVSTILSQPAIWGGTESLKAISELEKVNILVFAENDICYFPFQFDPNYDRTVAIVFRLSDNNKRNHYDSVAEVGRYILYQTAVVLGKNEMKRVENKTNPEKVFEC